MVSRVSGCWVHFGRFCLGFLVFLVPFLWFQGWGFRAQGNMFWAWVLAEGGGGLSSGFLNGEWLIFQGPRVH